ncbi:hypothetical protein DAEQUDRAFT_808963 [Daedalea quercina L-15889]|uniref:Gag1-like clamp domain-containing protein n=1 Tax=Daedalea quercina L-15889 TaxID=1314783 RepID=A0A165SUH9_9APHY|nr:hypothetical protein DAEQUDRAFT_808963 [Daedalea quercina L-15889]
MAPSPIRYRTPDSLDQDNWKLPSPALPSHTIPSRSIPHEDTAFRNDISSPQASAGSGASFEQRLASTQMPPPGPAYFLARRALWWESSGNSPQQEHASTSHRKLEDLLNGQDAHESDEAWRAGLGKVYRALVSGARMKKPMPLRMVVKIIMSGWIRDGTWPRGGVAPDPDDELLPPEDSGYMAPSMSPTTVTPDVMSRAVSPWSPQDIGKPRDPWAR